MSFSPKRRLFSFWAAISNSTKDGPCNPYFFRFCFMTKWFSICSVSIKIRRSILRFLFPDINFVFSRLWYDSISMFVFASLNIFAEERKTNAHKVFLGRIKYSRNAWLVTDHLQLPRLFHRRSPFQTLFEFSFWDVLINEYIWCLKRQSDHCELDNRIYFTWNKQNIDHKWLITLDKTSYIASTFARWLDMDTDSLIW